MVNFPTWTRSWLMAVGMGAGAAASCAMAHGMDASCIAVGVMAFVGVLWPSPVVRTGPQ